MAPTKRFVQATTATLIIILQLVGTNGQGCYMTNGSPCGRGAKEMYRSETEGRTTGRGCCRSNADEKEQMEFKAIAQGCSTSNCQFPQTTDICSTLPTYFVDGQELEFEQVYRENCSSQWVPSGHLAYCCRPDSLEGALVSTFGAETNEFPHQAGVSVDGAVCGGTIYNKRYVITAAHCVVDPSTRRLTPLTQGRGYKVNIGRNMWSNGSPENTFGVEDVIVHEGYSKKFGSPELKKLQTGEYDDAGLLRTYNDIALLRLDRDITFGPNVKAIRLAGKGFNPLAHAKTATIVGWGTSESGRTMGHLQKANFAIRTDERCFALRGYQRFAELKDKLLCLGGIVDGEWSPGTGSGDSGGPAICPDADGTPVLCGITSFSIGGINCIKNQNEDSCYPSVFVKVANFKKWVEQKVPEGQEESSLINSPLYGKSTPAINHQVRVTSRGKSCGGTLIKPDVVVTAAQCVMFDDTKLLGGLKVLSSSGKQLQIDGVPALLPGYKKHPKPHIPAESTNPKRIVMLEGFNANDLAIILLKEKVQGVRADQLPRLPEPGEKARGPAIEYSVATAPNGKELRQREFKIIDKTDCQQRLNRLGIIKLKGKVADNTFCGVEKYSGGSQCDRELGGGLICKGNVLCGIQSLRLCEWSLPNIFLDMSKKKGFVENAIQQLKSRNS